MANIDDAVGISLGGPRGDGKSVGDPVETILEGKELLNHGLLNTVRTDFPLSLFIGGVVVEKMLGVGDRETCPGKNFSGLKKKELLIPDCLD